MQANKTDSQIKQHIVDELKWDTRVDANEIGVAVQHGIVTLSGTVSSWAKRIAARDAAHRVAGVRDVADELHVKLLAPTKPTDAEIADAARTALEWHPLIPAQRITMTVANGLVTLDGTVDYASQREDTARLVGNIKGVCGVSNEIKVAPHAVAPDKLRTAIEAALERHATREANKLKLDIDGGTVTVTGPVDSMAERLRVVGAVWGTRGVEVVVDHTRVG